MIIYKAKINFTVPKKSNIWCDCPYQQQFGVILYSSVMLMIFSPLGFATSATNVGLRNYCQSWSLPQPSRFCQLLQLPAALSGVQLG
jgi:hypothetical protein